MEGVGESHEGLSPCRSSCWAALVVLLQVTRWEQRSGQQTHGHRAQQSPGPGIVAWQGVAGAYPARGQMALRKCVIPCGKTASGAGFPALTDLAACPCRCFSEGLWVRPWAGSEHLRASVVPLCVRGRVLLRVRMLYYLKAEVLGEAADKAFEGTPAR